MKKSLSIFTVLGAMFSFLLTSCGGPTDYIFEAEHAVLEGSAAVEQIALDTSELSSEEAAKFAPSNDWSVGSLVGMAGAGSATFTITADKAGKADLVIAASGFLMSFFGEGYNVYTNEEFTVSVNGTAIAFEDLDFTTYEETGISMMGFAVVTQWVEFDLGEISLNAGENPIVIAGVTGAPNVDYIKLSSSLKLSWTQTDNTPEAVSE